MPPADATSPPPRIAEFVREAAARVETALGVRPDLTPETLPLVDAYLDGARGKDGPVLRLAAVLAGCHFGEVLRRRFGGWWVLCGDDPASWRLELEACFLRLHPVGMAAEAIRQGEVDGFDGRFATDDENEPALRAALAEVRVAEDEYYSLAGRFDVLERIADWLVATRQRRGERRVLTPADYGTPSRG